MRNRLTAYRKRAKAEIETAFREEHTPHETATSFSVGVFITAMPTLGTGLLLFAVIAYLSSRVNKLALLASVIVLNPVVKWGVYATSFWLGTLILGPVPGISLTEVSFSAGPAVVARLLVGNLIIAIVFSVAGYLLALRLVRELHRREVDPAEFVPDKVIE